MSLVTGLIWTWTIFGNFEIYKSYDHMHKIRPISQIFAEILRLKNFEIKRFCCTLTYENGPNSLNLLDLGSMTNFKNFLFF